MAAEAAILGDHNPQGVADVNTCGEKSPESGVKGEDGAIFTGFTQIGPIYRTERNNLYLTRGSNSTSRVGGSASTFTRKTEYCS